MGGHISVARKRRKDERRIQDRRRFILQVLTESECVDCGEEDPVVLQFDHVRGTKKFNVTATQNTKWSGLLEELAKCEVVCANCHVRRSYGEKRKRDLEEFGLS